VVVCTFGFFKVCVDFLNNGCVYVWILLYVGVYVGFLYVWVCMCRFLCLCVLVTRVLVFTVFYRFFHVYYLFFPYLFNDCCHRGKTKFQ
jgi:hypothetical protein